MKRGSRRYLRGRLAAEREANAGLEALEALEAQRRRDEAAQEAADADETPGERGPTGPEPPRNGLASHPLAGEEPAGRVDQ
jgi:hypothetical protein